MTFYVFLHCFTRFLELCYQPVCDVDDVSLLLTLVVFTTVVPPPSLTLRSAHDKIVASVDCCDDSHGSKFQPTDDDGTPVGQTRHSLNL